MRGTNEGKQLEKLGTVTGRKSREDRQAPMRLRGAIVRGLVMVRVFRVHKRASQYHDAQSVVREPERGELCTAPLAGAGRRLPC